MFNDIAYINFNFFCINRGHLFWVRQKDSSYFIEMSTMDGNNRRALTTQVEDQLLVNPQSGFLNDLLHYSQNKLLFLVNSY